MVTCCKYCPEKRGSLHVVGFLAGKGDSILGEGDNGVSAVNNRVMSCEVGHSKENVIVV